MDEFEYKVSVIVPVYNGEAYIRRCLESLVNQTVELSSFEVLMIDDGSTDHSIQICQEYSICFSNFKLLVEENVGPSAARNYGISMARGKYIMFLDCDDTYAEQTIEKVVTFFDNHYEEIDLVAYYDQYYENGALLAPHMRYKFLTKTGIYDLKQAIYALQVRLNICIKNRYENNLYFDTNMKYQEDQYYCCEILKDKLKMGYVKEAQYNYMKNSEGLVGTTTNALTMFEKSTAFFEDIFGQYKNTDVPQYYQALFLHDIMWKFETNCLWPYHYAEEDFRIARCRIFDLLEKVDVDVIMKYPNADNYQKLYWVRQKQNAVMIPYFETGKMSVVVDAKNVYSRKDVEVILKRIVINNSDIKIVGFYKSPLFSICEKPEFYLIEDEKRRIDLDVKVASTSYYKAKERTDLFWGFEIFLEAGTFFKKQLKFGLKMDGIEYDTIFYNTVLSPFYDKKIRKYVVDRVSVEQKEMGRLVFENVDQTIEEVICQKNNDIYKTNKLVYTTRIAAGSFKSKSIWLYYDNPTVEYDNGFLQFIHDFEKDDEIERYYIFDGKTESVNHIFEEKHFPYVVEFGSQMHRLLYLNASKILTAFAEESTLTPFKSHERYCYNDLFHAEIIYLQHGILHAHLPWYYSPFNLAIDKVVVSSTFEIESYERIYGFPKESILPFRMPRYEMIDRKKKASNRIIFAPSWRSYLIGKTGNDVRIREGSEEILEKSTYYRNIMSFLNDARLEDFLEKEDLFLDVKLHPIFFQEYKNCLEISNTRVSLCSNKVDWAEYKAFITDFSSVVFDYAYLKRPILYFVPDYTEFVSGMNHYRELDLPFEDAFGKLTIEPREAVDELINISKRGFSVEDKFYKRMEKFFIPMEKCCEKLYQYLSDE